MIDPVSAVGGSSYLSTDDPTKEVVRMLLVLILMATGILLSHTAITSRRRDSKYLWNVLRDFVERTDFLCSVPQDR